MPESEPSESSESTDLQPQRRPRRWLKRMLVCLVVVLAAYPILGNLLLNTERGRKLILPRNDRMQIQWQSAWTLLPGLVHVYDLELDNRNRRLHWNLDADRGHIWINLLTLPGKRFSIVWARVEDFSCGFSVPEPEEVENRPRKKRPWRISIDGVRLARLRECHTGPYRLVATEGGGDGRLSGGFDLQIRGPMELKHIELGLTDVQLLRDGESIASVSFLDAEIDSAPFVMREVEGRQLLRSIDARLDFASETSSLGFLNAYLARAPWLKMTSGLGVLQARIEIEKGVLQPESRVMFQSEDLSVQYLDYVATGKAQMIGQVEGSTPRLAAAFQEFSVRQEQLEQAHILGNELMIRIDASNGDLAETPNVDVKVDLPRSRVPQLTVYNSLLPPRAGIEITGGSGTIEAHLAMSTRAADDPGAETEVRNRGTIELSSSDLAVSSGDMQMSGSLSVWAGIDDIEIESRALRLSDVRVGLAGFSLIQDGETVREDWNGNLELTGGALALSSPIRGRSHLDFSMTDSRPILTFFAEKKPKLETVARIVNVKDIVGSSELEINDETLIIDRLRLEGKRVQVEGRLCLGSTQRTGAIHVKAFGIGLGSWFEGKEKRWTLLRPRRWFEEKLAELSCRLELDEDEIVSKKDKKAAPPEAIEGAE